MAILETMILFYALAGTSVARKEFLDIYPLVEIPTRDVDSPTSHIAWLAPGESATVASDQPRDSEIGWLSRPNEIDPLLLRAINAANLDADATLELLEEATRILREQGFPAVSTEAVLATDPEEDESYLTIRLHIAGALELALQVDEILTERLIATGATMPSALSFAVYERDRNGSDAKPS
jgi:hypothetical protein